MISALVQSIALTITAWLCIGVTLGTYVITDWPTAARAIFVMSPALVLLIIRRDGR